MNTSIFKHVVPLALLSFGVAFGAKEFTMTSRTIVDQTLYSTAPKNGDDATVSKGTITFDKCTSTIGTALNLENCTEESVDEFEDKNKVIFNKEYTWQKKNPNTKEFQTFMGNKFTDGVFRLLAKYTVKTNLSEGIPDGIESPNAKIEYCNSLVTFKPRFKEKATVNSQEFTFSSSSKSPLVRRSDNECDYVTENFFYVSPEIEIGNSGKLGMKITCLEADLTTETTGCDAELKSAGTFYNGDAVEFTLTSKNDEFSFYYSNSSGFNISEYGTDGKVKNTIAATYSGGSVHDYNFKYNKDVAGNDTVNVVMSKAKFAVHYNYDEKQGSVDGENKLYSRNSVKFNVLPKDGYVVDEISAYFSDANKTGVASNKFTCNADKDSCSISLSGYSINANINVDIKFKKSGTAVTLILEPNEKASYVVVSNGNEYKASSSDAVEALSSVGFGGKFVVKAKAANGYVVDSVRITVLPTTGSGVIQSKVYGMNKVDGTLSYEFTTHSQNNATRYKIEVLAKKLSKVALNVDGLVRNVAIVDDSDNKLCDFVVEGVSSQNKCSVVEGEKVTVKYESYDGHPFTSVSCSDEKENLDCSTGNKFTMKDKSVTINMKFTPTKYALKIKDNVDGITRDFSYYNKENEKITEAAQFDTVYVKYDDNNHYFEFYVENDIYTNYIGLGQYYFVMPASSITGYGHYLKDVYNLNIENEGVEEGYAVVQIFEGINGRRKQRFVHEPVAYDGQSLKFGTKSHLIGIEDTTGYSLKSVACDITEKDKMENIDTSKTYAMPGRSLNCKFTFEPNSYKITKELADENGHIKDLKAGGEPVSNDTAKTDASVSFTLAPIQNYEVDFVNVFYVKNFEVEGLVFKDTIAVETTQKDGSYKFKMPASDVTILAGFKEAESSSSVEPEDKSSSSKSKSSSSSSKAKSSSSSSKKSGKIGFVASAVPMFNVTAVARDMQVANAQVGAMYAVFDMQGRVMATGRVESANFNISMPRAGTYMLRLAGISRRVVLR